MNNPLRHVIWLGAMLALGACDGSDSPDASTDGSASGRPSVTGFDFEEISLDGDFFTDVAVLPGRPSELLLATHPGEILHVRVEGSSATQLGSITVPEVALMADCGLLAVAADPDWETNHFLWVGHCTGADYTSRVTRLTFDGTNHDVAASAAVVIDVTETRGPFAWNHNMSNLSFEADGTMVFGVGDKSAPGDVGQDPNSLASTMMRIVPNREPAGSGYTPAADNPFSMAGGDPAVYAYGLRFPWRIVRDPRGWYYVADVGEGALEEVNLIASGGGNYGWPLCAGDCSDEEPDVIPPLLTWPHNDDHPYVDEDPDTQPGPRRAVWVAPLRPAQASDTFSGLDQTLVFGDTCTGWVRGAAVGDDRTVQSDRLFAHVDYVSSWIWGPDGTGWVTTFGSCEADVPLAPARLLRVVPRTE